MTADSAPPAGAAPGPLRLSNTLTGQVDAVEPVEPAVLRVYGCGPTVYSFAHIGNFRSFLTTDLLIRTARALGYRTRYVSNITDVGHLTEDDVADAQGEDKMARALEREGTRFANIWDLARFYTDALLEDWALLNLLPPDVRPRATEHVADQVRAVQALIAAGHAYETRQGVYFSVPSFPDYGKLSGNRAADALDTGAAAQNRAVVQDEEKRDPRDFALWKRDPGHLMQWHSPFGAEGAAWGFPGWHIECSVMAQRYLGPTIDVHTGGEDLIFPHHECEIAQAESLTGQPFANAWVHTRFLQVEGEKMSKSKGNFFTVRDLTAPPEAGGRGVDPLALRWALLSGHYRKPFNFTEAGLKAAVKLVARLRHAWDVLLPQAAAGAGDDDPALADGLDADYRVALDALADDLNTPEALAAVLRGAGRIYAAPLNRHTAAHARRFLERVNGLLGVVYPDADAAPAEPAAAADPVAAEVDRLLAARTAARAARDFARADALRAEAEALGVEVMDSAQGTTWRRKAAL